MQKVNAFTVTRLTLSGFKCFQEEKTFDFSEISYITGRNGSGKTGVADAIAFAVTGQPFFGDRSADRLANPDSPAAEVTMEFQDETGAVHTLNRCRKGGRTQLSMDGLPVRQTDLNGLFGEKDLFLSIFNPLYFIEVLGEEGKNLLEKLLPNISREQVLAGLSEPAQKLLENEKLFSPETFLKNRRAEIRELEDTRVYTQGQQDLLRGQEETRQADLAKARAEWEALQNAGDGADTENRLAELRRCAEEMLQNQPAMQDTVALEAQIRDTELAMEKRRLAVYESPYTQEIAGLEAELNQLYAEHAKASKLSQGVTAGMKCPACLRAVTEDNLESVKSELSSVMADIAAKGTDRKAKRAKLRALDEKAKQVFLQFQAQDITNLTKELDAWKERLQTAEAENTMIFTAYREKYNELDAQIRELDGQNQEKQACQEQIQRLSQAEGADLTAKLTGIQNAIQAKKRLVRAAVEYIAKRAELTFAGLQMNRVKIALTDIVKTTGEVKDVFRFTYDGRSYRWLSLSEKIRAGLEVSELLKNLTGRCYPTYIDNGESVTVIDNVRPSGQVLYAKVVPNAPLTVTGKTAAARAA